MFVGSFIAIIGLLAVIFHKSLAQLSVDYQNDTTGKILHHKLGRKTVKSMKILAVIIGTFMFIVGVLAVAGVIKFKS